VSLETLCPYALDELTELLKLDTHHDRIALLAAPLKRDVSELKICEDSWQAHLLKRGHEFFTTGAPVD
jgi:hypothetical protein